MRLATTLSLFALLAPALPGASESEPVEPVARLHVTISELRPDQGGVLLVNLYRGEDGWLEPERALARRQIEVSPQSESVELEFEGLEPGPGYALQLIHDRNRNGKLDMRWFPFPRPKEGAGVSNNHRRAGAPSYDKASFELVEGDNELLIEMWY